MAENYSKKKVYSIIINGLKESIDAVKDLNQELDNLTAKIKSFGKAGIKVKVDSADNAPDTKVKVSGNKDMTVDKAKELELQRQITDEIKAQGKFQAALTQEYRDAQQTINDTKRATKDMLAGAVDDAGNFTNTMAGWKAELRDLTAERNRLNLTDPDDVKRFEEIQQRAKELNTILKSIESDTGDFRRNVGNYPQLITSLTTDLKSTESVIASIKEKMSKLSPDTDGYKKFQQELQITQEKAEKLKKQIADIGDKIEEVPGFQIKVGDTVREFSSLEEAIEKMTKELAVMALEGKQNTKEFDELIKTTGRLKTALNQAQGELESYVGGAKGLSDVVEIMQGVSSIASISMGLQGLFGGQSQELDDALQKFTSISMIMNGLTSVQKVMNDRTSIWGVMLSNVWGYADKVVTGFGDISGLSKLISGTFKTWSVEGLKIGDELNRVTDQFDELIEATRKEGSEVAEIADQLSKAEITAAQLKARMAASPVAANDPVLQQSLQIETGKIDDARRRLTELANAGNNAAKQFITLDDVIQQGLNKALDYMTRSGKDAISQIMNMSKTQVVLARGFNLATAAVKGFTKATLILAAVQLVLEAIEKTITAVGDGFKYLWGQITGKSMMTKESLDSFNSSLEVTNELIDKNISSIKQQESLGQLTHLQSLTKQQDEYNDRLKTSIESMVEWTKTLKSEREALDENLGASVAWYKSNLNNVDEVIERWKQLRAAVEAGTDVVQQGGSGWGWWETASDAMDDFNDQNKALIRDINNEISKIDFSKPEQAVKQFDAIFEGELGEMRRYALANIDNIFPEEPWAQMLKSRIEQFRQFRDSITGLEDEIAIEIENDTNRLNKIIRDNNTAAIRDKNRRQKTQNRNAESDEIAEVRKSSASVETQEKAIASIRAKYRTMEAERAEAARKSSADKAKASAEKLTAVLKQIRDNNLAAERDSLAKSLKQLENQKNDEIETAKKNGVRVNELVLSINKKYDAQIAKAKEEWYRKMRDIQEQYNNDLIDNTRTTLAELQRLNEEMRTNTNSRVSQDLDTGNMQQTATISYDFTTSGTQDGVEKAQAHYNKLLDIQSAYIADKKALDLEATEIDYTNQINELQREYDEEMVIQKRAYDDKLKQLNDYVKQGLVTEEDYHKNLQQITEAYGNLTSNAYEKFKARKEDLTKQKESDISRIEQEALVQRQSVNKEYIDSMIAEYQSMYDNIQKQVEDFTRDDMTSFGLIKIKKLKADLKTAEQSYKQTLSNIADGYSEIQRKFDENEIDFNQFKEANKSLRELEESTRDALGKTREDLKNFSQTVAQNVAETVTMYMSQLNEIFNMFNDLMTARLDAEEAELEHRQDMLDKENEQLEKYYQKAQEITQKYSDNINGIEDELKDARGERRQFLIDQLSAQKDAQLSALENENEIQKQKEKNEKKQEALKKKQDALDKKRRQLEKKQKIASAVMSTAVAVTNALSVHPWFVGVALAAVAAAMGAAQIATISKQKIYEKGGVIDGARHKDGGVKIRTSKGISEVEGGEYITNRKSTQANLPLLDYINSKNKTLTRDDLDYFFANKPKRTFNNGTKVKFADGGQLPEMQSFDLKNIIQPQQQTDNRPIQVSVVDILNKAENVRTVQTLAGANSKTI